MTKYKLFLVTSLLLILTIPIVPMVTAFTYTQSVPDNTIYADDFESYTQGTDISTNPGWSYFDNDAGGKRVINNTASFSCCKSLNLQSSTIGGGKFDADKRFGRPFNNTRYIGLSVWFAFTTNINNQNLNNIHIAVETWDKVNHYECLTFFYTSTTAGSGVYPDFVSDQEDLFTNYRSTAIDHSTALIKGYFHHYKVICDIQSHKWVSAEVDGIDFSSTVKGRPMRILADTSFASYQITGNIRVEVAVQNGATHTSPTDNFNVWFDNFLVTDETPGQPPSIVQFAVNGSAIILLMFIGIIGILYYLRIGDRLMFGKGKGLFGSRSVIKYKEQRATTAEQEAKKMVKTIAIILIIGAILTAFGLYFAGFI